MTPTLWQADRSVEPDPWPHSSMITAIGRGLLGRCPACGKSHMFNRLLWVVDECTNCTAPLGLARADDAPAYFTILITAHIVVPLMIMIDRMSEPPIWAMSAIFLPPTLFMVLGLFRPFKGGTVGLMLKLNMLKNDVAGT